MTSKQGAFTPSMSVTPSLQQNLYLLLQATGYAITCLLPLPMGRVMIFRVSATYLASRRYVINMTLLTLPQGPVGGGQYDIIRWMNRVYCSQPECTTPYCNGYDCLTLFQQAVQRAVSWFLMPEQWRFPDGSVDITIIRSLHPMILAASLHRLPTLPVKL